LRALEGFRGHSRPATDDPAAPSGDPDRAGGLTVSQRALYDLFVADLRRLDVLQVVDGELVRQLAIQADLVEQARAAIEKDGVLVTNRWGRLAANPACAILAKASAAVAAYLSQCGLTPAARAKLSATEKKPETDSEMPDWFRNAGA
jgi:P27 family predicted phage terminase small subunit